MSEPPVSEENPTSFPDARGNPPASPAEIPASPSQVELPLPETTDTPADMRRAMEDALSPAPPPIPEPPLVAAMETPPLAGTPPPAATPPLQSFNFHGDAAEYFRIWIVNTLLTLVTFGVFAAWAKVRRRRYLRGNTELMGHRFDYRADPRRILVGNIVVLILFLGYMVVGQVYPLVLVGTFLVAIALLPWIVVRSLAFNAHNTAYRGLRFYYHQTYGMAAMTYLGQALALPFTLGLYYPAWIRNQREFVIANHRFGDAFFRFNGKNGPFYATYVLAGAMVFGAVMVAGMLIGIIMTASKHKVMTMAELLPFFAIYGTTIYVAKHFIYARLFNHVWNHTRLDDHRFVANMQTGRWLGLQLGNLGALIVSCGLLYPWAMVRSARYALSCLQFQPAGPIEKIARLGRDEGNALGETTGEFFGLDFGL